jgi:catechol 2,3-dioxygenase-like lactoylglutathione lyase family enzyme
MVEDALKQIVHMGFIVHDVDETVKKLADILGVKPWSIWILKPPFLRDTTVHGKNVRHGFKAAIATVGNAAIELLAPLEGESVYVEFLKQKGEGFHHIAFAFPTEKELNEAVKKLKDKGGVVIQGGRLGDLALYYYVDIKSASLVLELFTGTVPPPDKTYP